MKSNWLVLTSLIGGLSLWMVVAPAAVGFADVRLAAARTAVTLQRSPPRANPTESVVCRAL